MSKNIYVGNLPYQTTSDDLRAWFGDHGTVTRAQIATDRDTGRSRGFGFVEMSDGGDEAIAALNGSQLDDRTLKVNEARPSEERSRAAGGYTSYRSAPSGSGKRW
jgi:RNA recognition motif-containing protein